MHFLIEISNPSSGFYIHILSIISFIAILFGILIIIMKNPIVSVLHLIGLFFSISCYLILIGMVFIGLSYLLVYVGAVSILFLFILMLINIRVSELISDTTNNVALAIITVIAFFISIGDVLPVEGNNSAKEVLINDKSSIYHVSSNNWDANLVNVSDITSIGNIMYSNNFIWLMITSIILLLGMVGAIVITLKERE